MINNKIERKYIFILYQTLRHFSNFTEIKKCTSSGHYYKQKSIFQIYSLNDVSGLQ